MYIVDNLLTKWIENIEDARNKIKIQFEKIIFFYENVKAKNEISQCGWKTIEILVLSAYKCHLNPESTNDPNKVLCQFCQLKQSLKVYETIISSKIFNVDAEKENTGSYKVNYLECMMKCKKSVSISLNSEICFLIFFFCYLRDLQQ